MLKLRAPEGMTSFTHAGHPFEIVDGAVTIDDRHESDFAAHGFSRFDGPPAVTPFVSGPVNPAAGLDPRRQTLIRRIAEMSTDDIEAMLELVDFHPPADPDELTAEHVGRMNRIQLFDFLRVRGVSAAPPISNDRLREIAREHLKPAA